MILDVRPGVGIGPVSIGMRRSEVLERLAAAEVVAEPYRRGPGEGRPDLAVNRELFVYFDGAELVQEIELGSFALGTRGCPSRASVST